MLLANYSKMRAKCSFPGWEEVFLTFSRLGGGLPDFLPVGGVFLSLKGRDIKEQVTGIKQLCVHSKCRRWKEFGN